MCDERSALITMETLNQMTENNRATADQLACMVQQLGAYLLQLDARMRKQEELLQMRVTITSMQYKQLMAAIRHRANEIGVKYRLPTKALSPVRAAIRKELVGRFGVKDLHDLPESMLGDALAGAAGWDSYSTIRTIRRETEESV